MARKTRVISEKTDSSDLISGGLAEKIGASIHPDVWARSLKLKVDGHPFGVKGREFQIPILRDESEWIVIPKGAQLGLTTVFLVRTFHWIVKRKWHHLYLMPYKAGAIPFVQGRIDPIINSNEVLAEFFKSVDNRLHKQSRDDIALRIRGTNIWNELREIPSDVLIMDERDRMVEENIPEAHARLDGSNIKRIVELSTPTVPGHGVDAEDAWYASDMHRWYVPCPHCGRKQTFTVEQNVKIGDKAEECVLECSHCSMEISDLERADLNSYGTWQAENLTGSKRGYHINQLHSPTQTIERFMENYFLGQTDSRKLRAWFNNNRGEAFVAYGDQITPEMLDKCIDSAHRIGGIPNGPVYVGIDVGAVLHLRANTLDRHGKALAYDFKIFADTPGHSMWAKLDEYLSRLGTFNAVIDAHPEKSEAKALSLKYPGRVWIGFETDRLDAAETAVFNNPKRGMVGEVKIDRTSAFDTVIMRVMAGRLILPPDARQLGELLPRMPYNGYYSHLGQMVRDEEEDAKGRQVARWKKNKNPDHWHHAEMFAEIAEMKKPVSVIDREIGELFNRAGGLIHA